MQYRCNVCIHVFKYVYQLKCLNEYRFFDVFCGGLGFLNCGHAGTPNVVEHNNSNCTLSYTDCVVHPFARSCLQPI